MDRLYRSEIPAIASALGKQKTADEYREMRNHWAFLASVITNGALGVAASFSGRGRKPKMTSPDDFIDRDFKRLAEEIFGRSQPSRKMDWASLIEDAKEKGLKGPW